MENHGTTAADHHPITPPYPGTAADPAVGAAADPPTVTAGDPTAGVLLGDGPAATGLDLTSVVGTAIALVAAVGLTVGLMAAALLTVAAAPHRGPRPPAPVGHSGDATGPTAPRRAREDSRPGDTGRKSVESADERTDKSPGTSTSSPVRAQLKLPEPTTNGLGGGYSTRYDNETAGPQRPAGPQTERRMTTNNVVSTGTPVTGGAEPRPLPGDVPVTTGRAGRRSDPALHDSAARV
ncbi:hypothetical protein [Streptomyces lonarensis]|uniref:Uncharacterized protein n=1 Tax=Streptomyces lonarensis TaxID=700599 RepID=A0A7X6D5P1_9ACTN|nr:hypothetical protein [Streptomyces lonarensis]NJQ08662.1 hypothetical protein [Streptomyces lonarensis]